MSRYYPMMLQLKGKPCLVVGGGMVATRKIRSLVQAGARITVISPKVTAELARMIQEGGQIKWLSRTFEAGDTSAYMLVIAATNHPEVNLQVVESAAEHQLINVIDRPDLSNFIVPSTFQRGKLLIAVSTSGASPGLARKISRDLADQFDESYEEYLLFLEEARKRVLLEVKDVRRKNQILKELLHPRFLEMTRLGMVEEREARFLELCRS